MLSIPMQMQTATETHTSLLQSSMLLVPVQVKPLHPVSETKVVDKDIKPG